MSKINEILPVIARRLSMRIFRNTSINSALPSATFPDSRKNQNAPFATGYNSTRPDVLIIIYTPAPGISCIKIITGFRSKTANYSPAHASPETKVLPSVN